MRLWHVDLIPHLPWQQLIGQHRECCALRGCGWGKKHSIVDYVFNYTPSRLYGYHERVMSRIIAVKPGTKIDKFWWYANYRGKNCQPWEPTEFGLERDLGYPEHDHAYLYECLANLHDKGIEICVGDILKSKA